MWRRQSKKSYAVEETTDWQRGRESIDCGVHELSDCLKSSGAKGADLTNISLALQAYNFEMVSFAWARKNYQGYTKPIRWDFFGQDAKKKGTLPGDVDRTVIARTPATK